MSLGIKGSDDHLIIIKSFLKNLDNTSIQGIWGIASFTEG
jgi:hypothetical protein